MGYQWSVTDRPIGEEFLAIAREQIGKAIDCANDGKSPPGKRVHETRRRCKKLRALIRLVRPDFADYDAVNAKVRDAARSLSVARDARVTLQTLESLLRWADLPVPELPPSVEDEATELRVLGDFAQRMRELGEHSAGWRTAPLKNSTLATGFADTYLRGRDAARTALLSLEDEDFHEWRKQAKYHFNQLKLLERCAPDVIAPAAELAGRLAEELGTHHDLAILAVAMTDNNLGVMLDNQLEVLSAAESWQRELEAEIGRLGRQLYVETPRAIRRRFSSYLSLRRANEEAA